MRDDPRPAARPIVVIGGYSDPGIAAPYIAHAIRACLAPHASVICGDTGIACGIDEAGRRLIQSVQAKIPSENAAQTIEVDVIAVSMGGLVARAAALPREDGMRLHIANLYTLGTPHRGARFAVVPTLETRVEDMRAGSAFLRRLDDTSRDYAVAPYARLGDVMVGEANAAPPGCEPWWVPTPILEPAHMLIFQDPRILADIARRIRSETPLTQEPAAPLPGRS